RHRSIRILLGLHLRRLLPGRESRGLGDARPGHLRPFVLHPPGRSNRARQLRRPEGTQTGPDADDLADVPRHPDDRSHASRPRHRLGCAAAHPARPTDPGIRRRWGVRFGDLADGRAPARSPRIRRQLAVHLTGAVDDSRLRHRRCRDDDADSRAARDLGLPAAIHRGLLVGPVGLYIRRHVPESPEFAAAQAEKPKEAAAIGGVLRRHKLAVVLAIGAIAVSTCLNYFITYVPTYAVDNLGMTSSAGFWATLVSGLVLLFCTPVAGYFCDKVGRLTFMIPAALAVMVLTWVLFTWVVAANALSVLIVVVVIFSVLKATYYGPLASVMGDIFPTEVRGTGLSLGYNIGVAVFGGLTPLVAAWLIGVTGDAKAPAYWVLLAGALSVTAILVVWKKLGVR